MNASYKGYKDIVKMLLANKTDINIQNNFGYTALIWASDMDHKDIVQLLQSSGANGNSFSCLLS